jgi:hypothetical protein
MIDPLIQSVLNQNTEAELWVRPGARRQGSAARGCHEEASFRRPLGWRLGPARRRASPQWAKPVFSASFRRTPALALTVSQSQSVRVVRAVTSGTWSGHITGEVPPCPAKTQVTAGYKQATKGQPHARAAVTASYRHRPQGAQQRQSSPLTPDERQNLKQSVRAPVTRTVSPRTAASKWPAGTSSRQPPGPLRNIPTGTAAAPRPTQHIVHRITHELVRPC